MTKAYTAVNDRIVVRRKEIDKIGSVYLPDNASGKHDAHGYILNVGECVPETFKPGMTVSFGEFAGAWLDKKQELYVIVDGDINAIVEDKGDENAK